MTEAVEVHTGSRLHFGLLDSKSQQGRLGGIGMMIDQPGFVVRALRSKRDKVDAPPHLEARIQEIVSRIRRRLTEPEDRLCVDDALAPLTIRIERSIPSHRGFGSGTQLAFAVATAMLQALEFWPPIPLENELGRGGRSAVGTVGFRDGGFVIDFGLRRRKGLESGVKRRHVPEDWRFVVIDPQGAAGPSGSAESTGFTSLPAMPRYMPDLLIGFIEDMILPGLDACDFKRFAIGVSEYNCLVGEHFAPAQGGVYAHVLVRDLAKELRQSHWRYLAQSSWGPASVVFCEDEDSANAIVTHLGHIIPKGAANVFAARPMNRGAQVRPIVAGN